MARLLSLNVGLPRDIAWHGRTVHTGGVEWTIKDGIVYHAPELMLKVKQMVADARRAK